MTPKTAMPSMMSVVVIGRLMKEFGSVHDPAFAPLALAR